MSKYLNPKNWSYLVTRDMSLLQQYTANIGSLLRHKPYGVPEIKKLFVYFGKNITIYDSKKSYLIFKNKIIQRAKKDAGFVDKLKRTYHRFGGNLKRSTILCEKDDLKYVKKSINNFKKFTEDYAKLGTGLPITTVIGREVLAEVENNLKKELKSYSKQEISRYLGVLTFPKELTPAKQEEISLLKIAVKMKKKKKIDKELDKHVKNFNWVPVNFLNEPWDKKHFLKALREIMKNNPEKQLRETERAHKKIIKERNVLLRELLISKQTKQLAEILRAATYFNEYRKAVFCYANLHIRPFLNRIAKKFKLKSWYEVNFLLPEEILRYLGKKEINYDEIKNIVKKRQKRFGAMAVGKKARMLDNNELDYVEKNFGIAPKIKKIDILKGSVGCTGKTKGIVKIVLTVDELPKIKKGDILVTKMTTVDFVPAMRLASAFVTDEGGITCHAAIVAREMQKPCIIGTKIATKIFKDGDKVEVDAEKGIVKKI